MTEKWSFAAVMDVASKGAGYGGAERRGNDCIAIPNRSGLGVCSTAVPTFPRAVLTFALKLVLSTNSERIFRGARLCPDYCRHKLRSSQPHPCHPFECTPAFWKLLSQLHLKFLWSNKHPCDYSCLTSEWKNLFAWDELVCLYEQPPHRLTVSVFFSMDSLPQLVSSLKARNSCPDYEMVIIIVYNNNK